MLSDAGRLEQAILEERWRQLLINRRRIESQMAFTRSESRRVKRQLARLEAQRQSAKEKWTEKSLWMPDSFPKSMKTERVAISISGQRFEASKDLLLRDAGSLLAALAQRDSPLQGPEGPDPSAIACFNRDWWLFRYILNFLRDGSLPHNNELLLRLYHEASFWQLTSLQRAIEQLSLQVYRRNKMIPGDRPGQITEAEYEKFVKGLEANTANVVLPTGADWWTKPPNWWGKKPVKAKPKPADKNTAPIKDKWWTGSEYEGRVFKYISDFSTKPPNKKAEEQQKKAKKIRTRCNAAFNFWPHVLINIPPNLSNRS